MTGFRGSCSPLLFDFTNLGTLRQGDTCSVFSHGRLELPVSTADVELVRFLPGTDEAHIAFRTG